MDDLVDPESGTRSIRFDGTSAYISLGNPEDLQVEGIITLEACIKNESDPRPGQRLMPHRNIIAHGHDRVTEVFLRVNLFSMEYEVGTWIGETDATYMASAKIGISDFGKWIHLAGVFDGASWRLYRNGHLVGSKASTTGAVRVAGSEWAIGAKGGGADRFWRGCIAHVRVWRAARSAEQIAASASSALLPHREGLLRYWQLDDGGGRSAHELVGDADGELRGGCEWVQAAATGGGEGQEGEDNLYVLLGVQRSADDAQIKKAYRAAALKYHPDRNPGDDAHEKFKKIKEAYEVLVDPVKRARYDTGGAAGLNDPSGSGVDALSEMLMRSMGMRMGSALPKARDAVHAVACSLEDVYNGVDKTMVLERIDSPRATRKPHTKIVHVQKGMDDNARIVFRGDGDFIPGQCEPGDRVCVVQVQAHDRFVRNGPDLKVDAHISLLESLVGRAKVVIQHLDGRCLVAETPPATTVAHGQTMMIGGEGMPLLRDPFTKGDLYVQFKVDMPQALTEEQVAHLREALPPTSTRGPNGAPVYSSELVWDGEAEALVSVDLGADNVETVWMQDADMTGYGSTTAGGVTEEDDEDGEGNGGGVQCAQQ